MEARIRESEENFRNICENVSDAMIYLDRSGRIIDVNKKAVEVFGGSREELVGKHFARVSTRVVSLKDIPRITSAFLMGLADKKPHLNVCLRNKKGQEIHLECSNSLMKIDNKIVGLLVIARDITERKQAEAKMRHQADLLQKIFDGITDAIFILNVETPPRTIDCNIAASAIFGYAKEEMIGKTTAFLHVNEEFLRKFQSLLYPAMAKGNIYFHLPEFKMRRRDGSIFPSEHSVAQLLSDKGERVGWVSVVRDTTERKKAEEEIEKMAKFPSENPSPVLRIAKDGVILYANAAAQSLLSDLKTEIGQPAPYHWRRLVADALNSGLRKEFEVRHRDRIFLFTLTPVTDTAYVNVYGLDITERKRAEQALRAERDRLETVTRNIGAGLAIISKDHRTLWANELLKQMFGDVEGKICYSTYNKRNEICPGCGVREVFETGKDKVVHEQLGKDVDGKAVFSEITATPIKDKDGNITAVLELVVPITERKQLEEAVKESQERLKNIFAASPDAITVSDLNGNIVECNQATLDLLGFSSKEELIGKNGYELIAKKDHQKAKEYLKKTLEQGPVRNVEFTFLTKDGYEFPAEVSASVLKDSSGKPTSFVSITKDITERKKAEEELRKFKTISDKAGYGSTISDLEGNLTYVNESFAKMHGYTSDELIGKNLSIFHTKVQMKNVNRLKEQLKQKGSYVAEEVWHKRRDNTVFPTLMNGTLIRDEEGKPLFMAATAADITERKVAEEQLKESEEKYRNLFENARDLIITTDLEGNITSANHVVEEYGYDQSGIIGKNWFNLAPKDYLPQFRDGFSKLAQGKQNEGEMKIFSRRRQDYATVEYRSSPIIQDNKVVGVQVIVRDITERKKMEEKLRQYSEHLEELVQKRTDELLESEKRYSILVEEASDGVAILQDEKIVFANKKLEETLGYSKGKLIGLSLEKIVDEKYLQLAKKRHGQKLRREPTPETTEYELITRTGECVPVEVTGTRLDYQSRGATLVIVRDIRERKQMEAQRLKLEKLATIGELATMVAHDLRNPLTSIRNAGFYIKNSCPAHATGECKTAIEMLGVIDQEIIFANNIINDLLDFAAKRPLQKKRQNINRVIEVFLTENNIPKNIEIERKFAKKATIAVDEKQLERVFLNLTKNAVQAMPNGGKLTITTNDRKDHIEIEFADTGIGISEENMNKIFQPLFTTKAKGIGMGLPICKRIVEEHGGTIDVESKIGHGTTVSIKLPKNEETNNQ